MIDFEIKLCAIDPELFHAWEDAFQDIGQVSSHLNSIFEVSGDTLISPANSFGFMDGGIDALYTELFGEQLQMAVQKRIQTRYFGELPVGQAFVIDLPTPYKQFKRMIVAPTMRVPEHISGTLNAYHAFRAVLISAILHNRYANEKDRIKVLLCPGLGTGIGALDPKTCATQMQFAYHQVMGAITFPRSVFHAFERHETLLKNL